MDWCERLATIIDHDFSGKVPESEADEEVNRIIAVVAMHYSQACHNSDECLACENDRLHRRINAVLSAIIGA